MAPAPRPPPTRGIVVEYLPPNINWSGEGSSRLRCLIYSPLTRVGYCHGSETIGGELWLMPSSCVLAKQFKQYKQPGSNQATYVGLKCLGFYTINYYYYYYKSYTSPNPILPATTESGWVRNPKTSAFSPIYCLLPPAPVAVLELIKCGCDTNCSKNICSCFKGRVPCTSLCKCSDDECLNVQ